MPAKSKLPADWKEYPEPDFPSAKARDAYRKARDKIRNAATFPSPTTSLSLASEGLTALPREIGQLSALTNLYLSENQLTVLPPEIGQLTALTELSLSNNQLTALPPEIGQLTALTRLSLSNNKLTALPPEIGQLSALAELRLFKNQVTALPPEIGPLSALTVLSLTSNQVTALPPEIGQLTALTELYLYGNQLTALPPEFGQLSALTQIDVGSNPLPAELKKLGRGHGKKLIAYLRGAWEARKGDSWALPRRFDEAKVLLVGPGEVGKTWLLAALQGRKPRAQGATKGIEIAREPLEVVHPSVAERRLHLNCWDFGGQDHFQITHQIFFSAKAVYLLVWKPRTGSDPDLVSRLERIELSAGRTARVLIVSTHADGDVPAVLGKDALRERFGDLIGGFYETDSKAGAQGTGIAELREGIARAAAQLEGMELPFLQSWHEARAAVLATGKKTMLFGEFAKVCRRHGVEEGMEGQVAGIMEVQGHAVYFADAAEDTECCLAGDNLVVLDPEWLAQAAGFVIEDKPTIKASGILQHQRLAQIWKKDAQRKCPGYPRNLHGYLLWLLWRCDVAYRQGAETSLVPQHILRNRPDDLQWTPTVAAPQGQRKAILICRIPHTPPVGIVPALTAAVHALRRRQALPESDKLDRNWRDGFFLDTELRGTGYVELVDRDLRMEVRGAYPANLLDLVMRTLNEIVQLRWPRLEMDLRVPCLGRTKADKPCPGSHRKSYLEERRGKRVECEDCRGAEVDPMLDGFDAQTDEVLRRLSALKTGQHSLAAVAHAIFKALDPENKEAERAPTMLTILPDKGGWLSGLANKHVRVTCWCEHPDGPHPGTMIGSGEPPDYLLEVPRGWLVKVAPYITWASTLLKAFVPLAGTVYGQTFGSEAGMDLKDQIALLNDVAKALPAGKLETGPAAGAWGVRPEKDALVHIHDFLLEKIKPAARWGGLRPVRTKSGDILWLCKEHADIQQPAVLEI